MPDVVTEPPSTRCTVSGLAPPAVLVSVVPPTAITSGRAAGKTAAASPSSPVAATSGTPGWEKCAAAPVQDRHSVSPQDAETASAPSRTAVSTAAPS
ncbi:hypothetical protein [Amnibacterium kyonggiense]